MTHVLQTRIESVMVTRDDEGLLGVTVRSRNIHSVRPGESLSACPTSSTQLVHAVRVGYRSSQTFNREHERRHDYMGVPKWNQ
jgi:hypothetical protein